MFQQITIVGNLGNDPEIRYAQSGMAIGSISVAVSERVKDGDEWKEHTEWMRCTLFGKTAENAGEYLKKGSRVFITGRLRQEKYKDKEGIEKYSTKIMVDTLKFLDRKEQGDGRNASTSKPTTRGTRDSGAARGASRGGSQGRSSNDAPPASDGFIDDDLPFARFEPGNW